MNGKTITAPLIHNIAGGQYQLVLPMNFGRGMSLSVISRLARFKWARLKF